MLYIHTVNEEEACFSVNQGEALYLPLGSVTLHVIYLQQTPGVISPFLYALLPRLIRNILTAWHPFVQYRIAKKSKNLSGLTPITFETKPNVRYSLRTDPSKKRLEIICEEGEKAKILSFDIFVI